jgi:hypothetical protein
MTDKIVKISDTFWNVRGEFRVFGLLNIGTQASLESLATASLYYWMLILCKMILNSKLIR